MNDLFGRVSELLKEGRPFALVTVTGTVESSPRGPGARMIVFPDGSSEGTIGGGELEKRAAADALDALSGGGACSLTYDLGKDGKDTPLGTICGGKAQVFIEIFGSGVKLFVFGAGHVGRKLAELCALIGIPHWVVDDRAPYAREELFPHASGVLFSGFRESFAKLPIDQHSYLVIVTYGHLHDGECMEEALKTQTCYIGMIGSGHKVRTLLGALSKKGVNVGDPRIYAPVGLHLGDSSPEQIGISILSEILKVHSGGSGRHMREMGAKQPASLE